MTANPDLSPKKRNRLSREKKKAATRACLLEAAQALFAQRGFEGTSIDEISETAGYSRGAFYANFSDKLEVMKELIRTGFDSDIEAVNMMDTLSETASNTELYQQYAKRFYENPLSLLWVHEFQLSVIRHPELRAEYVKQHRRMREAVSAQLKKSVVNGERYADLFIVLQTGLSLYRLLDSEGVPEALIGESFNLLLGAIQNQRAEN